MKGFGGWLTLAVFAALLTIFPSTVDAAEPAARINLTQHPVGYLMLLIFFAAYAIVAVEEVVRMQKSKPVMLAAA